MLPLLASTRREAIACAARVLTSAVIGLTLSRSGLQHSFRRATSDVRRPMLLEIFRRCHVSTAQVVAAAVLVSISAVHVVLGWLCCYIVQAADPESDAGQASTAGHSGTLLSSLCTLITYVCYYDR